MLHKLLALCVLAATSALVGCGLCQDCPDHLGPVPDSVNYGDYEGSPRSGSAVGGTIYENAPAISTSPSSPAPASPAPAPASGSGSR